ncbi:hypothetical protein NCS52_01002800 [Fusarium sp. LHS14.1]|nr:hypothetical protein NCS52_01002800 [Fusarium sp. LHS14.1]
MSNPVKSLGECRIYICLFPPQGDHNITSTPTPGIPLLHHRCHFAAANLNYGEKNHEYRKYRLKDGVVRLWLYETAGGGGRASITHIASIPSSIRHEPGSVPTEPLGIGNAEFNAGLKQSKFGYPILELYELVNPVTLSEMKTRWAMGGAPMGWRYLEAPLWGDRWGKDHTRDDKVKKVF